MRALRVLALIAGGAAVVVAGACSPKTALAPNLPPETTLFVQFDPADTVPHDVPYQAHLYWLGTDADGFVSAYEIRFVSPADPADPPDVPWVRTTRTDSLFDVPTPGPLSSYVFQVRSIDDDGEPDPSPAVQQFEFSNQRPTVLITNKLRAVDTTYASVTLRWSAVDPDGDARRLQLRVWLDGREADAMVVDNVPAQYTVPSDLFRQGAGVFRSGPRTVFVQAIDPGGFASTVDSMTWFVRQPCADSTLARGRVLLIHDIPSSIAGQRLIDSLWTNRVNHVFAPGSIGTLRLESTQPFRSVEDMRQTFDLFDIVVWHRAASGQISPSAVLRDYQDGVGGFLDNGGTFVVEMLNLVQAPGATGALRMDWVERYLNCDSLIQHPLQQGQTSEFDFSLNGTGVLTSALYDHLLQPLQTPAGGSRGFAVRDTHDVALWAPVGTLIDTLPEPIPLGVRALQPAGGQAIAMAFFLRGLDRTGGGGQGAAGYLEKVLRSLPPRPPLPSRAVSLRRTRPR